MKIILNEEKLLEYMKKNGIRNYKQLCSECGINYNSFCTVKSRKYNLSNKMYGRLARRLDCWIEELQKIQDK